VFAPNRNVLRRWFQCWLVLGVLGVFLIALFRGASMHLGGADAGPTVQVRGTQRVGNYDTSVLRAETADALSEWFSANGLKALGSRGRRIVDDYIADGWCFLVSRLRNEKGALATPHPLQITFPAAQPVYPMKLTAVADSTTRVELFVIADSCAEARGFRCIVRDVFRYVDKKRDAWPYGAMPYFEAAATYDLAIGHPDVASLMWDDCAVTRLSADLGPKDMTEDINIRLTGDRTPRRMTAYSGQGRADIVRALSVCAIMPLLVFLMAAFRLRRPWRLWKGIGILLLVALVPAVAMVTYHSLPTVPVHAGGGMPRCWAQSHIGTLIRHPQLLKAEDPIPRPISPQQRERIPDLIDEFSPGGSVNPFSGERMRDERSPGNYSVRVVDGVTYLCLYDGDAREYRVEFSPAPAQATQPDSRPAP
jgi:hypothetical protein